jgi:hypothetical protein
MSSTIRIEPGGIRTSPEIEGLEVSDGEWQLHVDRYQDFIQESTGISPSDGLSASDCYRIGNRLQALIEERKRLDEWEPPLVGKYPDINSLEEFLWLARFFRACHYCSEPDGICLSSDDSKDCCDPCD